MRRIINFEALILIVCAVWLVPYTHLMWDDFLLVAIVLVAHAPIEHATLDIGRWLEELFAPGGAVRPRRPDLLRRANDEDSILSDGDFARGKRGRSAADSHSQTTGAVAGRIVSLNCDARLQKNGAQTEAQLNSSRDIALGLFSGDRVQCTGAGYMEVLVFSRDEKNHCIGWLVYDPAPPTGSAIFKSKCSNRPIAGKLRKGGRDPRERSRLAHPLALGEWRGFTRSIRCPMGSGAAKIVYRCNVRVKGRHDLGTH